MWWRKCFVTAAAMEHRSCAPCILVNAKGHTCAQRAGTAVLSLAYIISLVCCCLSTKCIQFNWSELKSRSLGNAQASIHRKLFQNVNVVGSKEH